MKPNIESAKILADALQVSLDYLVGSGEMKIADKSMIKRIEDINKMPKEIKDYVLHFIDMSIRDFKSKQAYNS